MKKAGQDLVDFAIAKRHNGIHMTIKEWQLTVYDRSPSSLWLDFFPKFLEENGINAKSKLAPVIWELLYNEADKKHQENLDTLVKQNRPTILLRGRPYSI